MKNLINICPRPSTSNHFSTISSSSSEPPPPKKDCRICFEKGHGYHFGVLSCRACAAFFRRCHFLKENRRRCRLSKGKCGPNKNGKWFCKTCRLERCFRLGMTPSNIQYDRDAYKSLVTKIKDSAENITEPKRDATSLILINKTSQVLPYVDLSQLVNKATRMLLNPIFTKKTKKMSNLEQLTHGLIELQWSQKDNLAEVVHLSVRDVTQDMERSMCGAAKWIMCSELIRNYQDSVKIRILQAIWYTWGRLERVATTAKLRLEKKCEEKHFVFSPMFALNLDKMSFDASCWTTLPFKEMQYFYVPRELFYEDTVLEMMEVKPNDVETTFIICSIGFHLTGKQFGGEIQEEMDHLQDVLSNDLHEYYLKNKNSMYLRRLKQLMRIKEHFLKLRSARMEKYEIGGFFNSFNPRISNPEFFEVLS